MRLTSLPVIRYQALIFSIAAVVLLKPATTLHAQQPAKHYVNVDANNVAIQGYDAVAYFTEGKPVKGIADHQSKYNGATYYFANAKHKTTFDANPERYIPQYGGFCAYAMSLNAVRPIDPNIFQIVDGRLMLQHTQKAYDLFVKNTPGNIVKADKNWPGIETKRAGRPVTFDKPAQ